MLLLAGCNPTIKDENGYTAYDIAVQHRNVPCAALLRRQRPQFPERKRAMKEFTKRFKLVDHPFRAAPPYYDTLDGEYEPSYESEPEGYSDYDSGADDDETDEGSRSSKSTATKSSVASLGGSKKTKDSKKAGRTGKLDKGHLKAKDLIVIDDREEGLKDPEPEKIPGGRCDAENFVREEKAYDASNRIRMAPPPRELLIPEHLLLPYAKLNFTGPRGAHVIHNLLFAAEEAERNFERRDKLANIQFEILATHQKGKPKVERLQSSSNRRSVVEMNHEFTALAGGGMEIGMG